MYFVVIIELHQKKSFVERNDLTKKSLLRSNQTNLRTKDRGASSRYLLKSPAARIDMINAHQGWSYFPQFQIHAGILKIVDKPFENAFKNIIWISSRFWLSEKIMPRILSIIIISPWRNPSASAAGIQRIAVKNRRTAAAMLSNIIIVILCDAAGETHEISGQ